MKIIIAGAGAMGSRFGLMLHQANHEVIFVDGWQEHINKIRENGLQANLNGTEVAVKIPIYNQKEISSVDFSAELIILFTKAMQLDNMMQALQKMISKETKVLCLLNGIGHEDVIKKYVPLTSIFLGNTMWTAELAGPGSVKLIGNGSIELQNLGAGLQSSANEIVAVLNQGGLNASYSDNIVSSIYRKACVNGTMNGLCTILDANMASFGETGVADQIVSKIVGEFVAIAAIEGAKLDTEAVLEKIKTCYNRDTIGLHHPSMYQDLIVNDRLTEIDYINGAIVRKGQEYGIETPYCLFLTQLVHAKEQILGAH